MTVLDGLGDPSFERADLVDAATERKLLLSESLSFSLTLARGLCSRVIDGDDGTRGTLRGGTAMDSSDGVDELLPEDPDRRSGVETAGLAMRLAAISGVEAGVGVLLYTSDAWNVFRLANGGRGWLCRRNAS